MKDENESKTIEDGYESEIKKIESEIETLKKDLAQATSPENVDQIARAISNNYLQIVKKMIDEKTISRGPSGYWLLTFRSFKSDIIPKDVSNLMFYTSQALKYWSWDASDFFFNNYHDFFSVIIFLSAGDNVAEILQERNSEKLKLSVQKESASHDVVARNLQKLFGDKLQNFNTNNFREILGHVFKDRLNAFKTHIEFLVDFVLSYQKDMSEQVLLGYADCFFIYAKDNFVNFKELERFKEFNQFISQTYFDNNEILKDIEFIKWLNEKELLPLIWENGSQDDIFFSKAMICCQPNQEEQIFVTEALQYLKDLTLNFKYPMAEGLLFLLRNLTAGGHFEYIQLALQFADRILETRKGVERENSLKKPYPESVYYQINDFYLFYSQPVNQLKDILTCRFLEIKKLIAESKEKKINFNKDRNVFGFFMQGNKFFDSIDTVEKKLTSLAARSNNYSVFTTPFDPSNIPNEKAVEASEEIAKQLRIIGKIIPRNELSRPLLDRIEKLRVEIGSIKEVYARKLQNNDFKMRFQDNNSTKQLQSTESTKEVQSTNFAKTEAPLPTVYRDNPNYKKPENEKLKQISANHEKNQRLAELLGDLKKEENETVNHPRYPRSSSF